MVLTVACAKTIPVNYENYAPSQEYVSSDLLLCYTGNILNYACFELMSDNNFPFQFNGSQQHESINNLFTFGRGFS